MPPATFVTSGGRRSRAGAARRRGLGRAWDIRVLGRPIRARRLSESSGRGPSPPRDPLAQRRGPPWAAVHGGGAQRRRAGRRDAAGAACRWRVFELACGVAQGGSTTSGSSRACRSAWSWARETWTRCPSRPPLGPARASRAGPTRHPSRAGPTRHASRGGRFAAAASCRVQHAGRRVIHGSEPPRRCCSVGGSPPGAACRPPGAFG